jgi:hypothetical protein
MSWSTGAKLYAPVMVMERSVALNFVDRNVSPDIREQRRAMGLQNWYNSY